MAEVVEFRVPAGSARTLLVWGLEPGPGLEHSLFLVFSKFGPLYSVRAHRNAAVAGPGYYAIIKFYSAGDASRAQRTCNGKRLFQKSPLKVCICARQKGFQQQVLGLNSNKCQQLANHYLGFNGWSSRIITLQNVSGFDGENEELGKTLQKQSVKYLCAVEVTLPNHGVRTRGVALGEADVENSEDPLKFVTATRRVQKLAVGKALSSAFQKILLVVLENGKVAVEYNSSQEEPIDSLTEEELKGLVQVNELSLAQFDLEEEEVLSDLSFDDELLSWDMPSN
ncbi:RAD52 motif-containing protein 1 [Falco biarmicus]|uniref:RAD52 motif-containing protein 1 n=1 Tax=Falco cherrug TaxID=345164 RepID=UPI00225FF43B|nr:RAD52 motif-containing protein 1 [Falco cherrug]XP_056218342.1 RAD52 motif-containing protein 1 [Falco biarmicus]